VRHETLSSLLSLLYSIPLTCNHKVIIFKRHQTFLSPLPPTGSLLGTTVEGRRRHIKLSDLILISIYFLDDWHAVKIPGMLAGSVSLFMLPQYTVQGVDEPMSKHERHGRSCVGIHYEGPSHDRESSKLHSAERDTIFSNMDMQIQDDALSASVYSGRFQVGHGALTASGSNSRTGTSRTV
jgi:hypothetical protein